MYKLSKYTLRTVDGEGGALWYNASTGVRRCLTPDEARRAQAWARAPKTFPATDVDDSATSTACSDRGAGEPFGHRDASEDGSASLARELVAQGFFVDANRRETRELLVRLKRERRADTHLGLTVLPTLDCNLACPYCVVPVTRKAGAMSTRVQQRLLAWWRERLEGRATCALEWMGGEPLLYPDTFWSLCGELLAIAKAEGVRVAYHGMSTNGSTVTSEFAEQLEALGIGHVQITLDGPEFHHNRSRPLATGGGSYDRVFDGLLAVASVARTQVRVNITRDNADVFESLLDDLASAGLAGRIHVYPARVFEPEHLHGRLPAETLDQEAFGQVAVRFALAAMERGFSPPRFPSPVTGGFCGAYRSHHFVVGPQGYLYRCSAQVTPGAEHAVGTIFSDTRSARQHANQVYYDRYGPAKARGCFDCPLLPICFGGCPEVARVSEALDAACVPWRFSLETQLVIEHEWMKLTGEALWNGKENNIRR